MAKRKRSGRPPQAQHSNKSKPSQHDKRQRLATRNPERRRTERASVSLIGGIAVLVTSMSRLLDRRIAFRLPIIFAGAMRAGGRRTAANWFRCAGVMDDWDRFYELLQTIGKNVASLMTPLLSDVLAKFDPGEDGHWLFMIDDPPTKRFGPCVEAATAQANCSSIPARKPRPKSSARSKKRSAKRKKSSATTTTRKAASPSRLFQPGGSPVTLALRLVGWMTSNSMGTLCNCRQGIGSYYTPMGSRRPWTAAWNS